MSAIPKDTVHRVVRPCSPGFEGKWCVSSYFAHAWKGGGYGVYFWYFDTEEEARAVCKP
jgi:hypothetical protein